MGKTITVKARGLWLGPNALDAPDGSLSVADNVVISRDGVIEPIRGRELENEIILRRLTQLMFYRGSILGYRSQDEFTSDPGGWNTFRRDGVAAISLLEPVIREVGYEGSGPGRMPWVECGRNLYLSCRDGVRRLDAYSATLMMAGTPRGLDCGVQLTSVDGLAIPANSQVAYRVVFGYRDANDNIILGAPSQRGVVRNRRVDGTATRTSNVVTVTSTAHGFVASQYVTILSSTDETLGLGVKGPIGNVTTDTFTYSETGSNITTPAEVEVGNNTRDALISATIPPGIDPNKHFVQGYRSRRSLTADVDPGEELYQIYEGSIPKPATGSTIGRSSNVVTIVTTADHGFTPGTVVYLAEHYGTGFTDVLVAGGSLVGLKRITRSTNGGSSWSTVHDFSDPITGFAFAPSLSRYVALTCAANGHTSIWTAEIADLSTWTQRSLPTGASGDYHGVANGNVTTTDVQKHIAWNGSSFLLSNGVWNATSTDGITWTTSRCRMQLGTNPPDYQTNISLFRSLAWTGTRWVGVTANPATSMGSIQALYGANDWTLVTESTFLLYDICQAGSWMVAVGARLDTQQQGEYSGSVTIDVDLNLSTLVTKDIGATYYTLGLRRVASNPAGSLVVAIGGVGVTFASGDWANGSWYQWGTVGLSNEHLTLSWNGPGWGFMYLIYGGGPQWSTGGTSWTSGAGTSGCEFSLGSSGGEVLPGAYTITTVPNTTTFTFASVGTNLTTASFTTSITPLAVGFQDSTPDTLASAALYTNAGQEGILQANDLPPQAATDMAMFREHVFFSAPTPLPTLRVALIAVGGTVGVQSGDVVNIGASAATAASSENVTARQFQVVTSNARPSENISATLASLMRVVNVNSTTFGAILVDISSVDGIPGQAMIQSLLSSQPASFSVSAHPAAWSPGTTSVQPAQQKNALYYSKAGRADAVPATNAIFVGSANRENLRIIPTRNSLFVLKGDGDGIYQITGYGPPFQLDPFDLAVELVAPRTAVALDNQVFALCQQGVVRISDTGTTLISRAIDSALLPLLAPAMRAVTRNVAFGVADEADHKFYLWLPTTSSDTRATQAFVYDLYTEAWTRRTDTQRAVASNPADDLLYFTGDYLQKERKTFTGSDYQNAYGAGWDCTIEWCPRFGDEPASLNHFREVGLFFDAFDPPTAPAGVTLSFTGNLVSGSQAIVLKEPDIAAASNFMLRAIVPPETARASLLFIRYLHPVTASSSFRLRGLSLLYTPGRPRFGR